MQDWIWGQNSEELSSRYLKELAEAQRLITAADLLGADSLAEITRKVRASYGKQLDITAAASLGGLAGLYMDYGSHGEVSYYVRDTKPHQIFTLCHEFMHALGKHKGCTVLNSEVQHAVEEKGYTLEAVRGHGAEIDFEEIVAELGAHLLMYQVIYGRESPAGRGFR